MAARNTILEFWLNEVGREGWYKLDPAIDERITRDYLTLWQEAAAGGLTGWTATAPGALAYLILTDQFPRNMFRGTAQAFASDPLARRAAKAVLIRGLDRLIPEPGRQFFYLPLMHSESLSDQELCICRFLTSMPETGAGNLTHAVQHRDVIRRFGRFPSRNAALGRPDTQGELAYRAAGGYMG